MIVKLWTSYNVETGNHEQWWTVWFLWKEELGVSDIHTRPAAVSGEAPDPCLIGFQNSKMEETVLQDAKTLDIQ